MKWILDVGSGHNPWPQANILADLYMGSEQRRGLKLVLDHRPFVCCDIQALPFKTQSLSFIHSRQVIEHVKNPELAINELKRTGKHGYAEVPSKYEELFLSSADHHLWIVDFKAKQHRALILTPFRKFLLWFWTLDLKVKFRKRLFAGLLKKFRCNFINW